MSRLTAGPVAWAVLLLATGVGSTLSLVALPAVAALSLLPGVVAAAALMTRPRDRSLLSRLAWRSMAVGTAAIVAAILGAVLDQPSLVSTARMVALAAGIAWLVLLLADRAGRAGHLHVTLDLGAAVLAACAVVVLVGDTTGIVALGTLYLLLSAVVLVTGLRPDRQLQFAVAASLAGGVSAGSLAVSERRLQTTGIDDVGVLVSLGTVLGTGVMLALLALAARTPATSVHGDGAVGDLSLRRAFLSSVAGLTAVVVLARGSLPGDAWAMSVAVLALVVWGVRAWLSAREETAAAVARRQAETDDLTGLPNRRGFTRSCTRALGDRGSVAVLLLDLDGFKLVNDSLGHPVGDELLRHVAGLLRRTCAGEGHRVARLGGDEFVVWATGLDEVAAERLADRLGDALDEPVALAGIHVSTSASIGIAVSPDHGTDVVELLRAADLAMYVAKRGPRGRAFARPSSTLREVSPLVVADELADVLAGSGEPGQGLLLRYQPILELVSGRLLGVEALSRWRHPTRGEQAPEAFLAIAATTGLLTTLTDRVLRRVGADLHEWDRAGLDIGPVSVNLSPADLVDSRLVDRLLAALVKLDMDPERLVVEVSEDTVMADATDAVRVLRLLRDRGVGVALDDFGTGRSSLAYLRMLPLTSLKLDRSFLSGPVDARSRRFLRATAELAHALGLAVVAEGVEDRAWVPELVDLGFDAGQGYALGVPMAAGELVTAVRLMQPGR